MYLKFKSKLSFNFQIQNKYFDYAILIQDQRKLLLYHTYNTTTDFHKCMNSTRQTERLPENHSGPHVWRVKDLLCIF